MQPTVGPWWFGEAAAGRSPRTPNHCFPIEATARCTRPAAKPRPQRLPWWFLRCDVSLFNTPIGVTNPAGVSNPGSHDSRTNILNRVEDGEYGIAIAYGSILIVVMMSIILFFDWIIGDTRIAFGDPIAIDGRHGLLLEGNYPLNEEIHILPL